MANKQTLTKSKIALSIAKKSSLPKTQCVLLVDRIFEKMKDCLIENEKIQISGFGKFVVRKKKDRKGRNPKTGETIKISARRVVTFKSSPLLRRSIEKFNAKQQNF